MAAADLGCSGQVDDQRGKLVAKEADTFTICWEDGSESDISAFEAWPKRSSASCNHVTSNDIT